MPADVGLIHINGRDYDPLLARFGTANTMTENLFSTQGWNRHSYVGNSPLNFTDPSGYCFLECFWKGHRQLLPQIPILGSLLQIATAVMCGPAGAVRARDQGHSLPGDTPILTRDGENRIKG